MKINKQKAFTLIEMMVVIALMAVLLLIIVGNFSGQKTQARDNVRISGIQDIRLALEEYKLTCGEYPESLNPTTHNGIYGNCPKKFGDFLPHMPENPNYAESPVLDTYFYKGLSSEQGGPCYDYYVAVALENKESKEFKKDHDWNGGGSYVRSCKDSSGSAVHYNDTDGWYDFRSQKGF